MHPAALNPFSPALLAENTKCDMRMTGPTLNLLGGGYAGDSANCGLFPIRVVDAILQALRCGVGRMCMCGACMSACTCVCACCMSGRGPLDRGHFQLACQLHAQHSTSAHIDVSTLRVPNPLCFGGPFNALQGGGDCRRHMGGVHTGLYPRRAWWHLAP